MGGIPMTWVFSNVGRCHGRVSADRNDNLLGLLNSVAKRAPIFSENIHTFSWFHCKRTDRWNKVNKTAVLIYCWEQTLEAPREDYPIWFKTQRWNKSPGTSWKRLTDVDSKSPTSSRTGLWSRLWDALGFHAGTWGSCRRCRWIEDNGGPIKEDADQANKNHTNNIPQKLCTCHRWQNERRWSFYLWKMVCIIEQGQRPKT